MANQERLHVEQTLNRLLCFLDNYLPLANAHVADFLIEDYWKRFIPERIQRDLLELSEPDLARLPSCALYEKPGNHCLEKCGSATEVTRKPSSSERTLWDRNKLPEWKCHDLKEFVTEAHSLTLPNLGVLTDLQSLMHKWQKGENAKTFIRQFMSEKKSHEVDIMAEVCSLLASSKDISTVIDIGSGRGYLSSHLSLMHKLSVLAVDSSTINTKSAQTRSQRLEKHWAGLVRNAKSSNSKTPIVKGSDVKISNGSSTLTKGLEDNLSNINITSSHTAAENAGSVALREKALESIPTDVNVGNTAPHAVLNTPDLEAIPKNNNREGTANNNGTETNSKRSDVGTTSANSLPDCVSADIITEATTNSISTEIASCNSSTEAIKQLNYSNSGCNTNDGASRLSEQTAIRIIEPKCVQITQFVTPSTDLQALVQTHLMPCGDGGDDLGVEVEKAEDVKVLLTGLHTCGNLAPSMLEIFSENPAAGALCNVGCCYHHLDEAFTRSPFEGQDSPEHFGFPMSQFLTSRRFQLGRNARMLASQTPARMASAGQVSHRSLFYRALLQVMLRDLTGQVSDDWHVGKIFAKSRDFQHYTEKALKKLQINDHGKWTWTEIEKYEVRHAEDQARLTAFVQLRAALAPVIESLILLDRLLFLHEQDLVTEAHLVQLFDSVTSPRCFGLIAVRR